jgi:hypothetical protein
MSDYDASTRYSAFRRRTSELVLEPHLTRFALGVQQRIGRAFLGDGLWGQVRLSQRDSGLLEGGVHLADETA